MSGHLSDAATPGSLGSPRPSPGHTGAVNDTPSCVLGESQLEVMPAIPEGFLEEGTSQAGEQGCSSGSFLSTATHRKNMAGLPRLGAAMMHSFLTGCLFARLAVLEPRGLASSPQGNDLMGVLKRRPAPPGLPGQFLTQLGRKAGVPSRMFGDQSLSACWKGSPRLPVNPGSGP